MAKGKKTPPETVNKVMALWFAAQNYEDVAREVNLHPNTVRSIVERHKDKPEFVEARQKMKVMFSDAFLRIIAKALKRLEKDLDDDEVSIPIHHLTTVVGTLIDKLRLIHDEAGSDGEEGGVVQITQTVTIKPPEDDADE